MWRNWVKSGLVFFALNMLYFMLTRGGYTVITLLSHISLAILACFFVYVYGSMFVAHYIMDQPAQNPLE